MTLAVEQDVKPQLLTLLKLTGGCYDAYICDTDNEQSSNDVVPELKPLKHSHVSHPHPIKQVVVAIKVPSTAGLLLKTSNNVNPFNGVSQVAQHRTFS